MVIFLISDSCLFFASLSRMNKSILLPSHAVLSLGDFCCCFLLHNNSFSYESWAADAAFNRVNVCWDFFVVVVWREVSEGTVHFLICSPIVLDINPPQACAGVKKHICETAAAFICVYHSKEELKALPLKSHVRFVSFSHCCKDLNSSVCPFG